MHLWSQLFIPTLREVPADAGKLRVKATANRTACAIVHELIDAVLRRDYEGELTTLLERALAAPIGESAHAEGESASRRSARKLPRLKSSSTARPSRCFPVPAN